MADKLEPLVIELRTEMTKALADLDKVKGKLNQVEDSAERAQKPVQGAGDKLMGLAKAGIAFAAGSAVVRFLTESAKAAANDAKSFELMARQMQVSAGVSRDQSEAINQQISSMSMMAGVVDDDIRNSMSGFIRVTKDSTKALELSQLALDVSAGTGKDLASVTQAMSKAYAGQDTALTRMVPGIKNATDKFQALKDMMGGAAKTAADANPFQKLNVAFDSIKESLGRAVLPIFSMLADILVELSPVIEEVSQVVKALIEPFMPLIKMLVDLLMPGLQMLTGILTFLVNTGIKPFMSIISALLSPLGKMRGEMAGPFLSAFKTVNDMIMKFSDTIGKILGDAFTKIQTALKPVIDMWNQKFGPMFKKIQPWIEETGNKIIALTANGLAKMIPYVVQAATAIGTWLADAVSWLHDRMVDLQNFMKSDFVQGVISVMRVLSPLLNITMMIGEAMGKAMDNVTLPDTSIGDITAEIPTPEVPTPSGSGPSVADTTAQNFADALKSMSDAQAQYVKDSVELTKKFHADMRAAQVDHQAKIRDIMAQGRDNLAAIIRSSKDLLTNAFRDATKIDAGSMFMQAGMNVDNMLHMLKDKLAANKDFASDLGKLSGLGYSQEFIDQIVAQGPQMGDQMAKQLIQAGPAQAAELQGMFSQVQNQSAHGVDALADDIYKKSGLATEELKEQYKTAHHDLVAALNAENRAYVTSLNKLVRDYKVAMATLAATRDQAQIDALNTIPGQYNPATMAGLQADLQTQNQIINKPGAPTYNVNVQTTSNATAQTIAQAVIDAIKYNKPVVV